MKLSDIVIDKINIVDIYKFINNTDCDKIYLDVDGVILHSCQAMCDVLNEMQGTDFVGSDVVSWNFREICPNLADEDIERLFSNDEFFQYVEWIDGVSRFLDTYRDRIVIVTKGTVENYVHKIIMFNQFGFNDIPIICIPLNASKGLINMKDGIFIDDSVNNLNESNAKYKVCFYEYDDDKNREWQENWNGLRLYSWE